MARWLIESVVFQIKFASIRKKSMFSIEPKSVDFPFNFLSTNHNSSTELSFSRTIKLRNTSGEKCRFSIHVLEENKDFRILQHKVGAVFPGKYETVTVEYSPATWGVSKAVFYVKSSNSKAMVPVTITGIVFGYT